MKLVFALAALIVAASPAVADEKKSKGTRFWNLTGETVSKFELAAAGTTTFGADQAKNDKDGNNAPNSLNNFACAMMKKKAHILVVYRNEKVYSIP